jgi:serine phosphatase RsbU (regulator of sigma subunit)
LPNEVLAAPGWQISAAFRPARQTSGDFYDAIPLPDGRLGLLVADVVDKGVSAALFMALSWILIRTYAVEFPTQPELVLSAVNRRLLAETGTGQFFTIFYGILDPAAGRLTYSNAGHPPPLLLGKQYGEKVRALQRTGMALGVVETETWDHAHVQLGEGDLLVLYSDGITDATDEHGLSFGRQRLEATLQSRLGCSAKEVQEALFTEIEAFSGVASHADDVTLMIIVREA